MEFFIGWLLCAGIVGVIAQHARGRNGGGWFLLALVISPLLAFILVMCLPKRLTRQQIRKGLEYFKTVRECPFCAETVKLQAKVCKHCHSELPAAAVAIIPAEPPRRERLIEW
jgi:hypothetical protein